MPTSGHRRKSIAHKGSSKPHKRSRSKSVCAAGGGSSTRPPTRHASVWHLNISESSKAAKSASGSPKEEGALRRKLSLALRRASVAQRSRHEPHRKDPDLPPTPSHLSEDEFSPGERKEIQKRHSQVVVLTGVAVVAVVVVLAFSGVAYMLIAPSSYKWVSSMRGFGLMDRMAKACHTDDCKAAVAKMRKSVDATVNPCEDLYHYACGHWRNLDNDGKPMSYQASLTQHYVLAVNGFLTGGASPAEQCRSDVPSAKLACVYASCVAFFTNRSSSISSMLTAADLNVSRWVRSETFVKLFSLVVRTAFLTRLPSVLSVKRQNQSALEFEFGTCLSCCSDDSGFRAHLLDVAAKLSPDWKHVNLSDVLRLDDAIREISQASWNLPVQTMDVSQFESLDQATWYRVIADIGAFSSRPEDIQTVSANPRGVDKIVTALSSVPLAAARLYTLLAPVAPYFAVELFQAGLRDSMTAFRAWQLCADHVTFLFTGPFETFFSSSMGTEKADVTFRNMLSYIRLAAVNALHLGKDLELSKDGIMAVDATTYVHMGSDDPAFSVTYGEDFMANLILYHRNGSRHLRAAMFLSDTELASENLPTNYFLPDFYYSGATEQAVNSGTLGAFTAYLLFTSGLPKTDPVQYAECFAKYARNTLKLPVNKTMWLPHTEARWALETAFEALQNEHEQKELDAMHYMRFARTYCGEDDAHILHLQFAVRSSENFNRTFECGYKYPVIEC